MAWIESTRYQRAKTWVDGVDPTKHAIDAMLGVVHYESTLDSGNFDTEIDTTPVRVNDAALDGWTITTAGWHYALGKPKSGIFSGLDGVVGFGGRKGQNWLKFRLTRVGYLHWSDLAWQDVGGTPTYTRSNLTSAVRATTLGAATINVESVATWSNIWTTPSSGALNISWTVNGDRLKEIITINQTARTWITANRPPTTPANETYFGFVFQLDWSDVPKIIRDGVQKLITDDFAGDVPIQLRDSLDRLLAFLPVDDCWVEPVTKDTVRQRLSKRFYKDGDSYYLLVGLRCDTLAGMPSGTLVFDPTIDAQVGAGTDDTWRWLYGWDTTSTAPWVGYRDAYGSWGHTSLRFTGISGLSGATITDAHLQLYGVTSGGSPQTKIYAEDAAAPAAPTSYDDFLTHTLTTAAVDWDGVLAGNAWNDSPDISSVIQELANSYDPSAIQIYHMNDGVTSGGHSQEYRSYDGSASNAPKLHIDYTEAATPASLLPATKTRRLLHMLVR